MSFLAENQSSHSPSIVKPQMGHRWYVYGNTKIDEHGKKAPLFPIREKISGWRSCSHIQTVLTAADGSSLVYGVALDLDYKHAEDCWKTKGKLDHKRMKSFVDETYPTLGRYLCTWTRSTGGQGLGAILFFDPFIHRHEKTGGVSFLAERVQSLMIRVLNGHGFGCDESATGIVRMTPNWRNPRILLHKDEVTIRRVQRDNERHQALRQVYNELRRSKLLKPRTKKDAVMAGERFAVKDLADEGLSRIYAHILDSEPETLKLTSSYEALARISGLSLPTLRLHLSKASWLDLERVYGEGLNLTLKPSPELSERAYSGPKKTNAPIQNLFSREDWLLPEPEYVIDDERNKFLWRRSVILRNEGYPLDSAISLIREESSRIPGAKESRNCRNVEGIVCSIFRHSRRERKAKRKISSLEALTKSQSYVSASSDAQSCLNATKEHLKGDLVPEAQSYYPASAKPRTTTEVKVPGVGEPKAPSDMVSSPEENNIPSQQGGAGDLPPERSEHDEELSISKKQYPRCDLVVLGPSDEDNDDEGGVAEGRESGFEGEEPSHKCSDKERAPVATRGNDPALEWAKGFLGVDVFTKRARGEVFGKVLKIEAFAIGALSLETGGAEGKIFKTLREARAAKCREHHPVERLERVLERLGTQVSQKDVLDFLAREHMRLQKTKDRGLRYSAPEGRFKRLAEAWSFVSPAMRVEFLNNE